MKIPWSYSCDMSGGHPRFIRCIMDLMEAYNKYIEADIFILRFRSKKPFCFLEKPNFSIITDVSKIAGGTILKCCAVSHIISVVHGAM